MRTFGSSRGMKVFFNSSLPRTGSTLLQNILGQNPDFYTTATSGLLEMLIQARHAFTHSPEYKAQGHSKEMMSAFRGFCRGGVEGYFKKLTNKSYVVDKCRGWGVNYEWINKFYPNPKMICTIRDPKGIFASMENIYRKNPEISHQVNQPGKMLGTMTVKRMQSWLNENPVGLSFDRLHDLCMQGIDKNMHFVKFEELTNHPQREMDKVYKYLGVNSYKHDFDNIEQVTQENDSIHGVYGDHVIRQQVKPVEADYERILSQPGVRWTEDTLDWMYSHFGYEKSN